jgi:hypothetical protein
MAGNSQSPQGDAQPREKPDRSKCPSDETLKAVAHGKQVEDEALEAHLAICAYCRKELIDHKAQRELGRFFNKTTWLLTSVVVLMISSPYTALAAQVSDEH